MYFAEIPAIHAILFSPKIKVATRKTAIYSTVISVGNSVKKVVGPQVLNLKS